MIKATPQFAKRFKWWWRGLSGVTLTGKGQTRREKRSAAPSPVAYSFDHMTKGDVIRCELTEADFHHAQAFFWKSGTETAAHGYELVRRLHPSKATPPWPDLRADQQRHLRTALGRDQLYWIQRAGTRPYHEQYEDPDYTEPMQWNLRATDSALRTAFRKFIYSERRRKGLIDPKKTVRLPPKNSVSWRWLEVWDLHELAGQPLDSSGHGMMTSAERQKK